MNRNTTSISTHKCARGNSNRSPALALVGLSPGRVKTISLSAHDQCGLFTRARASSRDNGKRLLDLRRTEATSSSSPSSAASVCTHLIVVIVCWIRSCFYSLQLVLFFATALHSLFAVIIWWQFMRDECSTRFMGQFFRTRCAPHRAGKHARVKRFYEFPTALKSLVLVKRELPAWRVHAGIPINLNKCTKRKILWGEWKNFERCRFPSRYWEFSAIRRWRRRCSSRRKRRYQFDC